MKENKPVGLLTAFTDSIRIIIVALCCYQMRSQCFEKRNQTFDNLELYIKQYDIIWSQEYSVTITSTLEEKNFLLVSGFLGWTEPGIRNVAKRGNLSA